MWRPHDCPWSYHRLISYSQKFSHEGITINLNCEADDGSLIQARSKGSEWGYFSPYETILKEHLRNPYEVEAPYVPLKIIKSSIQRLDLVNTTSEYEAFFCVEGACYDYPHLFQLGLEDQGDRKVILAAYKDATLRTSEDPDGRMQTYKALDLYTHLSSTELIHAHSNKETLKRLRSAGSIVPYVLVDDEGRFTEMSEAWCEQWGIDWKVGATPWTMSPGFQPCGVPSQTKAGKMIQQALMFGTHLFPWVHTHIRTGLHYHCTIQLLDLGSLGVVGRMVGERGQECPLTALQGVQACATTQDEETRSRFG